MNPRPCPHATPAAAVCPPCASRRRRWAAHAQRKRDHELAAAQMQRTRCPRRSGKYGECGGRLETVILGGGATSVRCPWCERRKAGICRDCPRPVEGMRGRAIRCAEHKQAVKDRATRNWAEEHPEKIRAQHRRRMSDPERRARTLEYKRAWRKANRDKIRAQKRRAALKQPERVRTYMARYRAKHREHYREMQRRRYYAEHPARPAPRCKKCGKKVRWVSVPGAGRPPTKCYACCWPHERRKRIAAQRRRLQRLRELDAQVGLKPKKIRRPAARKLNERGERLCVGADCAAVLTGRAKKCHACKAKEAAIAAQLLAQRQGRGRRTDRERAA